MIFDHFTYRITTFPCNIVLMTVKLLLFLGLFSGLQGATVLRLSCGGTGGSDAAGNIWSADANFVGGTSWGPVQQPAMAAQPIPYRNLRYSAGTAPFTYTLNFAPGSYNVTLKWIEPNKTAAGQRLFQATISPGAGTPGIDIFALAGGALKPYDKTYAITTQTGQIIVAITGSVGNGILSGIQVDSISMPPPVAPTYLELTPVHPANLARPADPNMRIFSNADNVGKIYRMDSSGNIYILEGSQSAAQTICTDTSFPVKTYFTQTAQTGAANIVLIPAGVNVTDVWIIEDQVVTVPPTIQGVAACVGTVGTPCGYAGAFPLMGVSVPNFRQYPSSGSIAITSNADQQLQLQLSVTGGAGNLADLTGGVVKTRVCIVKPATSPAAALQPKVMSGQDILSPSGGDTNYVAWVGAAIKPGKFGGGSLIGMYNDGHDSAAIGMCQGGGGGNSLCVYSMDAYDKANVANTKFSVINNMPSYGAYADTSCFDGIHQMKSRKVFALNGKLYAPIFCMNGPAPAAGQPWEAFQSGMIVSPDAGSHWCNYKTYTSGGNACTAANWQANGDNPRDAAGFQWPLSDGTNKVTRQMLVDFLCQDNAIGCPVVAGADPLYLYFLASDSLGAATTVMRVLKTADPMLPANWSVYSAGSWSADVQSATDVGGGTGGIGCCGAGYYLKDFATFAIWQHPNGFATAPAPWGPWTSGAPILPSRQGFPGPVAGLCPKYDVAGRVTCTVFGAPATDLSIYEEDLGLAAAPSLLMLQTCQGSTPNSNCAGIYRAAVNTSTGPLVVTGVTGVQPDTNTWTAVR